MDKSNLRTGSKHVNSITEVMPSNNGMLKTLGPFKQNSEVLCTEDHAVNGHVTENEAWYIQGWEKVSLYLFIRKIQINK